MNRIKRRRSKKLNKKKRRKSKKKKKKLRERTILSDETVTTNDNESRKRTNSNSTFATTTATNTTNTNTLCFENSNRNINISTQSIVTNATKTAIKPQPKLPKLPKLSLDTVKNTNSNHKRSKSSQPVLLSHSMNRKMNNMQNLNNHIKQLNSANRSQQILIPRTIIAAQQNQIHKRNSLEKSVIQYIPYPNLQQPQRVNNQNQYNNNNHHHQHRNNYHHQNQNQLNSQSNPTLQNLQHYKNELLPHKTPTLQNRPKSTPAIFVSPSPSSSLHENAGSTNIRLYNGFNNLSPNHPSTFLFDPPSPSHTLTLTQSHTHVFGSDADMYHHHHLGHNNQNSNHSNITNIANNGSLLSSSMSANGNNIKWINGTQQHSNQNSSTINGYIFHHSNQNSNDSNHSNGNDTTPTQTFVYHDVSIAPPS
eukprot:197926_1